MLRELTELRRISSQIGRDRHSVQGPGGNTSIKQQGVLWIKASGTWLAHAETNSILVPVDLAKVRSRISENRADALEGVLIEQQASPGLRPSIETTFHAALNHRVVLHTHSVAVIAMASRQDAEAVIGPLLEGLDWLFVHYARPGMPLTKEIMRAQAGRDRDVIVLANHGLIVGGDGCNDAMALLNEVERRILTQDRPQTSRPDLNRLAALADGSAFELPQDESFHRIALEPDLLGIASAGSLYPDHVVFLGPRLKVVEPDQPISRHADIMAEPPPVLAIRGLGVLVRRHLPPAALAMVGCLADVLVRIPAGAPMRYLSTDDEAALLNWGEEHARQALNR
jgi:rhamnose utilization protein RhaD (predicted bifunctional aldolase and dehydrogenase)